MTCNKKDADPAKNILDFLYLYREFNRGRCEFFCLLSPLPGTDKQIHSFTAAFYLGLKKKFEGNIDHLRATIHEERPWIINIVKDAWFFMARCQVGQGI